VLASVEVVPVVVAAVVVAVGVGRAKMADARPPRRSRQTAPSRRTWRPTRVTVAEVPLDVAELYRTFP
jgi:hypothetical protein